MIPCFLRISGFLSYAEPVELDFTGFDLACISGSNGAGKSSLLDAITWVLFGEARRKDETIINSRSTAAEVMLEFEYEGNYYRVQRGKVIGKPTVLEFQIRGADGAWHPLTEHTLGRTEERIVQTLRMDYETFTNASFFLQGKADQFATQRPGDRKRILSSILGLDAWEEYRTKAAEQRRGVEENLALEDSRLNEIEQELAEEPQRRNRLAQIQSELDQAAALRQAKETVLESQRSLVAALEEQHKALDLLKGQLETARGQCLQLEVELGERQTEQRAAREKLQAAGEIETGYKKWQEARQELERWEAIAVNFRQLESQRSTPLLAIESERARLEQEQASLRDSQAKAGVLEANLPGLEAEQAEMQKKVEALATRLATRPAFEEERRNLEQTQVDLKAENNRLKQVMHELHDRIEQLKKTSDTNCPLCGKPLSESDRAAHLASLEIQGKSMGDQYRTNQEALQQNELRVAELSKALTELQPLDGQQRDLQRRLDQVSDRLEQTRLGLIDWQTGGAARLAELERILKTDDFALESRTELARVDSQLKSLGYDAAAHDAVRQSEQSGRSSEEMFRALESARAAIEPLEREIAGLETRLEETHNAAEKLEEQYQQAKMDYDSRSAGLPDLERAEAEVLELREHENHLRLQVGAALQEVEVLAVLEKRKEKIHLRRDELKGQVGRLKMLERACSRDGVPAMLIEEALPEIEERANQILDRLTAGSMSVRFETQREYRDKGRDDKRETLDIIISDPAGVRAYELFSGGESFRINFAIRLALSHLLAQRAGARLQTLVIDEGFGSQDAEGRHRLLEAINMVKPDFRCILVITHLEELKDAFPARIEVEKTPTGSRLRVLS